MVFLLIQLTEEWKKCIYNPEVAEMVGFLDQKIVEMVDKSMYQGV